jgi:hypothetical protein
MAYQPLTSLNSQDFPKYAVTPLGSPAKSPETNLYGNKTVIDKKNMKAPFSNPSPSQGPSFPQFDYNSPERKGAPLDLSSLKPNWNPLERKDTSPITPPAQSTPTPSTEGASGNWQTPAAASAPSQIPPQYQQQASSIASFPGLMGSLANLSSVGSNDVRNATDALRKFQTGYGQSVADIQNTPIPLEFQQGRQQILQGLYSQQLPAYQEAVSNALASQGQMIQGLGTAAGLAAPQSVPLTNQPFYPVEGLYSGGGGGLGARAVQAANVGALQDLVPQYQQQQATFQGIKNLEKDLTNFMGVNELNPTTFPIVNQAIATILTRGLGDPQYQQLQNYMAELTNRYAGYFGGTAAPTNMVREITNGLINGNARPEDIMKVLEGLNTQAAAVMQGNYQAIQNISSNPGGVMPPQGQQGSSLYDF